MTNNMKEYDDLVSIVIPVYNAQAYLSQCMDSILRQTYQNFEVILIDDGSTDNSGSICDDLSKKDSRIRTYHIKNGGVGNARNVGMTYVKGKWFTFVDADDWIEAEYLKTLLQNAYEYRCDVSGGGYVFDYEQPTEVHNTNPQIKILCSSEECIHNFICPGLSLNGMSTLKLYRYDVFGDVKFDTTLKVNEDCLYVYEITKKCSRACVTSDVLYHWYVHPDSACHKKAKKVDFSAANVFLTLLQKTDYLCDSEIVLTLRKNYVSSVTNVLFFADFSPKDEDVKTALQNLKKWKKEVWGLLSQKQKMKYICVVDFRWLLPMIRKVVH